MTKADRERERLEAFEMWVWRRMEKIIWVDKVTDVEVLQKVEENRSKNAADNRENSDWTHFEAVGI